MGGTKKQYSLPPLEIVENPDAAKKKKTGYPPKPIDWDQVDKMIVAGANGVQCASVIGLHPDTLYIRCEKEKGMGFSAYHQQKRSKGDYMIHAAQFETAIKNKNPTMLIWLGKQRCDQRESDNEATKAPPLDLVVDTQNENMALKAQIAKMASELEQIKAKLDNQPKTGFELPGVNSPL